MGLCCELEPVTEPLRSQKGHGETIYSIDPLNDPAWDSFICDHPEGSLFHTAAWLRALRETYGYEAIAFTTSPIPPLLNGIVFCKITSWLTGNRLVSLPFSDHCQPLMNSGDGALSIASVLELQLASGEWDYIEIRPPCTLQLNTHLRHDRVNYQFHKLDLQPELGRLFEGFHKSSIQRKIVRAERERLVYIEGSTEDLLEQFYRLFVLTRKRHHVPPQPKIWFNNLRKSFGPNLRIRLACKQDVPIAAMITIAHRDTMTYKYGCSDQRFHSMGPMHFLFWKLIQEAKISGFRWLDFGRTDADQRGLITFKNRWGASSRTLVYSRFSLSRKGAHVLDISSSTWKSKIVKAIVSCMPTRVFCDIGEALYRHVG